MSIRAIHGDCRDVLKTLPDESVHCVVTSPPFFGLRDYGVANQIGLEATPDAFVAELVAVFREVRRVLRNDGTLWLNLGDSYGCKGGNNIKGLREAQFGKGNAYGNQMDARDKIQVHAKNTETGLPAKNLIGIPWRVAFALQADGWILRQDIIWSKPNPMPESVRDRCTKAHEYIFLLSKSPKYFWDAVAIAEDAIKPPGSNGNFGNKDADARRVSHLTGNMAPGIEYRTGETRNKRSVWEVATQPFSEAHFATFPPALIEPCIKAGCPAKACATCGKPWVREVERTKYEPPIAMDGERFVDASRGDRTRKLNGADYNKSVRIVGEKVSPSCSCNAATVPGTVLDCFSGAGTTGLVADRLGRDAILIELNEDYSGMSRRRIHDDAPLFAEVLT